MKNIYYTCTIEIQDGTNPLRFQIFTNKFEGLKYVTMVIKTSNSTKRLSCSLCKSAMYPLCQFVQ